MIVFPYWKVIISETLYYKYLSKYTWYNSANGPEHNTVFAHTAE